MSGQVLISAPPGFPPAWAGGWGEDERGCYAELVVRNVRFELRWIPPGSFLMGSPEAEQGRDTDEGPRHGVTISRGFWLGATPCTQEQWQAVMGENPSHFKGPTRPVECVSWDDCRKFCQQLNGLLEGLGTRLPTEAEWEYACRAETLSAFNDGSNCTEPTGEDPALDKLGWFDKNSGAETHPVGEKAPNAWVLYDMHGNVWEWCEDHCDWKEGLVTDTYIDDTVDPLCEKGAGRVVRGGSCWGSAGRCRSASRGAYVPGDRGGNQGFRLAAGQEPGSGAGGSGATGLEAEGAAAPGPEAPAGRPDREADRPGFHLPLSPPSGT